MKSFEVVEIKDYDVDLKKGDFVIDKFGHIKRIGSNAEDDILELKIDEILTDKGMHYMKIVGPKEKLDLLRL